MGLFKSSGKKKPGLTLLQGLFVLAIIGVIAAVIVDRLAG
jgi:hypothetical protein